MKIILFQVFTKSLSSLCLQVEKSSDLVQCCPFWLENYMVLFFFNTLNVSKVSQSYIYIIYQKMLYIYIIPESSTFLSTLQSLYPCWPTKSCGDNPQFLLPYQWFWVFIHTILVRVLVRVFSCILRRRGNYNNGTVSLCTIIIIDLYHQSKPKYYWCFAKLSPSPG